MKLKTFLKEELKPSYILTEDLLNEDDIPSFCNFVIRNGDSITRIISGNKSNYGASDKMLYTKGVTGPLGKASFRKKATEYWNSNFAKKYPNKKFKEALEEYLKHFNDWGIRN